ncbi:hypothetical protein Nepgr_022906 [Nepenthes gracilis]|uniref:Uncharacterized protein n=1 Tax=Nepenthes gracilis TaxID=150966 RepID=A0AAD3T1V0_NEPGR|nr:hypothetical protein Nepgr_022906 [Nepenthes gracilis]
MSPSGNKRPANNNAAASASTSTSISTSVANISSVDIHFLAMKKPESQPTLCSLDAENSLRFNFNHEDERPSLMIVDEGLKSDDIISPPETFELRLPTVSMPICHGKRLRVPTLLRSLSSNL